MPDSTNFDNVLSFIGMKVTDWAFNHGIYLSTSSNYYIEGNGLAKSSNKNLIRIIKHNLQENKSD